MKTLILTLAVLFAVACSSPTGPNPNPQGSSNVEPHLSGTHKRPSPSDTATTPPIVIGVGGSGDSTTKSGHTR